MIDPTIRTNILSEPGSRRVALATCSWKDWGVEARFIPNPRPYTILSNLKILNVAC
jgi:hypothetical protein